MKQYSAPTKPHPREAVSQPCTVEDGNGGRYDGSVIDVSQEGFRLKVPQPLAPGSDYTLHLDREAHRVEIRWASPGEVGGLFLEKLP